MFYYFRAFLLGGFGGAIIGNQLIISLNLFTIIQRGYYVDDDIFFTWVGSGLFLGVPCGALIGALISLLLTCNGAKIQYILTTFVFISLLSIFLASHFEEKIRPPLIEASYFKDQSQLERLIKHKSDLDVRDINGQTALIVASKHGSPSIVEMLIKAGADVNIKDNQGGTALMNAVLSESEKHYEIVTALIKAGADVNARNIKGATALILAVIEGNVSGVRVLIQAGAYVNIKDNRGLNALLIARQRNEIAIEQLLQNTNQSSNGVIGE
jgi:hypothetical protein